MMKSLSLFTLSLLVASVLASCVPSPSIPPTATPNLTSAPPTVPPATVPPATSSMLKPGDQLGDMVITTGQGENPMIWDYCDPIITEPGPLTVTRECEVPAVPQSFLALVKPFT